MQLTLTTPAIIFPAITLLLLTYSNRFSALSKLIRNFVKEEQTNHSQVIHAQIKNFHTRLHLIQLMEAMGITGLLLSVSSSISLYLDCYNTGEILFLLAIVAVFTSLLLALFEVILSTRALHIDMDAKLKQSKNFRGFFVWLHRKSKY